MDSNLPPLPWTMDAQGYPGAPVIKDADGAIVCGVYQRSGHPITAHPATDAAANLILAAPEAVRACELMHELADHFGRCHECGGNLSGDVWFCAEYRRLRAESARLASEAVAKTKGESA